MTQNTINPLQSTVFCGLGTQTYNVTAAGLYTVAVNVTIPYVALGSSDNSTTASTDSQASALNIQVKLNNGSSLLTLSSPAPTQPFMAGKVVISCALNDVITVIMASSAASDNAPNAVKGVINIYQGE